MTELRRIDSIKTDAKPRGTPSQLASLAESMSRSGLLNPVTITSDGRLIAGRRRLSAAKMLTWTEIPVHVVSDLADLEAELRAEREENTERVDMTTEELARSAMLIEEQVRVKALARRGAQGGNKMVHSTSAARGGSAPTSENGSVPTGSKSASESPTLAAQAVGMGRTQYKSLKRMIVDADAGDVDARNALDRINAGAPVRAQARALGQGVDPVNRQDPWFKRWQGLAVDARGMARSIDQMPLPTDMTQAARWADDLRRLRTTITQTIKRLEESVPR